MPVATHALSGNFSALVGEITRLRATIHANSADGSWVNELDDEIKLGGALLNTANDGTFTVTLPTSTGTGLQYEVRAQYVDPADQQRKSWSSGWFDLTANANVADKANDSSLRVNPSLGAQLAQRIDGFIDHGNVSGAVTFSGPVGSHWFDATAATTITLDGFTDGQVVSLLCFTGADDVTVTGLPDLELVDGLVVSAIRARGVWLTGGGGGGTPVIVDPPLAAPASLAATNIEEETATVTWSAVSGAAGYAIRVDGGTWQYLGNVLTRNLTGLIGDVEYDVDVAAYVTFANRGTSKRVTFRTDAPVVQPTVVETFNGAEGISLTAYDSPVNIDWLAPQYNNNGIGDEVAVIRNNAAWRASSAVSGGGGRFVSVSRDLRITAAYSFPLTGGLNDQVRIFGRGDVRIILEYGGGVRTDSAGIAQTFIAGTSDFPKVGTVSLEIIDTAGKVYLNGTQVGSFTVSTTLNDTDWGFYCYQQALVTDFKVEAVTVASPAPSLTPGKPYGVGTVITSDAFTGADAASIHNRVPDATLGGVSRSPWYQTDSTIPFALAGGKLARSGTSFGGVALYAGQQDVELKVTLATVPVGGSLRLYIRKQGGEGVGDGLWLNVSDTAITPQQQGGTALSGATSFGAPAVGDVYTVSMSGSTATFTAKRSGGASIGAGTQTFAGTSYATKYPLLSIVATGGTSAVAIDDVIVSGA